jgi:hypothetical protein
MAAALSPCRARLLAWDAVNVGAITKGVTVSARQFNRDTFWEVRRICTAALARVPKKRHRLSNPVGEIRQYSGPAKQPSIWCTSGYAVTTYREKSLDVLLPDPAATLGEGRGRGPRPACVVEDAIRGSLLSCPASLAALNPLRPAEALPSLSCARPGFERESGEDSFSARPCLWSALLRP